MKTTLKCFNVSDGMDYCIVVAHTPDEALVIGHRDNFVMDGEPSINELSVQELPETQFLRDDDGIDKPLSWWAEQTSGPGMLASTLM